MVNPIPEGYHTVTPYLAVPKVGKVLAFVRAAFDAEVLLQMDGPGGAVQHAEVQIGDSRVMLGEPMEEQDPVPGMLYVYVEDVNATYQRALQAGATTVREPEDQFYGDRNAGVRDPSGNLWWIATHVEDVPPEELERRAAAQGGGQG